MIQGQQVMVVMPSYNAAKTLEQTIREIPRDTVDGILVVDDDSADNSAQIAEELGVEVVRHAKNLGYGGNQKTCYKEALNKNYDVIVMLHPDYQYEPRLLPSLVSPICYGVYDVMLGSRILGGEAVKSGMPRIKYFLNRLFTFFQNLFFRRKLSEYHTGYRAYHRRVLEKIAFQNNSNNFVFDNQLLAQIIYHDFKIGELSCPTKYFKEASSIGYLQGAKYLMGCAVVSMQYFLAKCLGIESDIFKPTKKD